VNMVEGSDTERYALNSKLRRRDDLRLIHCVGTLVGAAVRAGLNLGFSLESAIWEHITTVHCSRFLSAAPQLVGSPRSPAASSPLEDQLEQISLRHTTRGRTMTIAGHHVHAPLPPRGWKLGSVDVQAAAELQHLADDPACVRVTASSFANHKCLSTD